MRSAVLLPFLIVFAGVAQAASFAEQFAQANALAQSGDTEAALTRYRELLIEEPDSEALRYAVAAAHHRAGRNAAAQGARESAQSAFETAKTAFDELVDASDAALRAEAALASADTLVQQAQLTDYEAPGATAAGGQPVTAANAAVPMGDPENYKRAVSGWRKAVAALESVVREYPALPRAQHNLDAARYRLKKLLQNPPENPEQENPNEEEQPPPPPQEIGFYFQDASTDIPGANAEVLESGDTIRLQPAPTQGGSR